MLQHGAAKMNCTGFPGSNLFLWAKLITPVDLVDIHGRHSCNLTFLADTLSWKARRNKTHPKHPIPLTDTQGTLVNRRHSGLLCGSTFNQTSQQEASDSKEEAQPHHVPSGLNGLPMVR